MNFKRVMFGKKPAAVWDEPDPAPAKGSGWLPCLKVKAVAAFFLAMTLAVLTGLTRPVVFIVGDHDYTHRYSPPDPNAGNGFVTVAGEYTQGDGLGRNWALSFLPDGRYSFRWSGCLGVYHRESGFVKRVGEYVVLSAVGPIEPRIARVFRPVKWGHRTYLIPPEELEEFCDAVIKGDEPRNERAHGYFYVIGQAERVGGVPELPEPWATLLRKTAVIGTVVEVAERGRARIDLGSADGITAESILTVQGREHLSSRQLKTVSVHVRSCEVEDVYPPSEYEFPLAVGSTVVAARASEEKATTEN